MTQSSVMAGKKPSVTRVVLTGFLIVTGLYVACVIGLTLAQRRLMYFPCHKSVAGLQAEADGKGFKPWFNLQSNQIGWFRLSQNGPAQRRVLLLHGNAGCAPDWFGHADVFQALEPSDFYILEYPGFGARKGRPTQKNILAAADDAFRSVPGKCPVYLLGESLGTGVTTYLAGGHADEVGGIFLVAPYNSIAAVAGSHLPLFPIRWMLRDTYPSSTWLAQYHGPVAVLLAGKDRTVPMELGRSLYDGYQGRKKLWIEAEGGHEDVHKPNARIMREVVEFWAGSP